MIYIFDDQCVEVETLHYELILKKWGLNWKKILSENLDLVNNTSYSEFSNYLKLILMERKSYSLNSYYLPSEIIDSFYKIILIIRFKLELHCIKINKHFKKSENKKIVIKVIRFDILNKTNRFVMSID